MYLETLDKNMGIITPHTYLSDNHEFLIIYFVLKKIFIQFTIQSKYTNHLF